MEKALSVLMAVTLILALFTAPVNAQTDTPQQGIFDINITTTVYGDLSATMSLSVKLVDKAYIEKFSSDKNGKEEFRNMILQLVYENLAMDIKERGGTAELRNLNTLPNWMASVVIYIPRFLEGKGTLRCPYSGNLNFVYMNRVLGYRWNKFTLILPENLTGVFVFPVPENSSRNVFVWKNGDFIPLIEAEAINFTPLTLNVTGSSFTAVFRGNMTKETVRSIVETLKESGARNLSWNVKEGELIIRGRLTGNMSFPYRFKNTNTEEGKNISVGHENRKRHEWAVLGTVGVFLMVMILWRWWHERG